MEYVISDKMKDVKGSLIRELFKVGQREGMISFAGGNPSLEAVPSEAVSSIAERAFKVCPKEVFMYGLSEGYGPLREVLKEKLSKEGMDFENNDIIIVSGAQQAADIAAKVLLNEKDGVVLEDPTFTGCLNTFKSYGAGIFPVPLERDGLDISALKKVLEREKNIRLLYVIPTFQNPTGFVTSLKKRQTLLDMAQKYNFLIFEDDPYGELRFKGKEIRTLKSMDKEGRCIYAGSFSKVMAPAMRVGFMVLPKALMQKATIAKQVTDVHTNLLFQYVCAEFMKNYDYEGHVKKIRALYSHKEKVMAEAMEKYFPGCVSFKRPEGGLFIMAFLPKGMDSAFLAKEALKRSVAIVPESAFSLNEKEIKRGFRLNYTSETDENIEEGIKILGNIISEALNK